MPNYGPDYATIKQAILTRTQIRAFYKDKTRVMCPHMLGTKQGAPQALFYQFAGGSNSDPGLTQPWRCLKLRDISQVRAETGDGQWYTEPVTKRSTCLDWVDVEVEPGVMP